MRSGRPQQPKRWAKKPLSKKERSNVLKTLDAVAGLVDDLEQAIDQGKSQAAAWIEHSISHMFLNLMFALGYMPHVRERYAALNQLEKNNKRKHPRDAKIRSMYDKITKSPEEDDGFFSLSKPGGVYDRIAKRFNISSRRVRFILKR